MTALPPSPFIVSSALSMDVSAAAATSPPAPLDVAAVINSCREHVDVRVQHEPGPAFATGMSSAAANTGGEHEAVTALPIEHERFCIELESGTSPGACGTERGRVGAVNSESFSCLETNSGIGSARETSAMLHPGVVDGSTTVLAGRDSGDRAERRSPNSDPVDHPTIPPTPDTADDASASPLFSSIDPEPCGVDFEAELDALEIELLLVGIPINARTFFTEAVSAIEPASCSSA